MCQLLVSLVSRRSITFLNHLYYKIQHGYFTKTLFISETSGPEITPVDNPEEYEHISISAVRPIINEPISEDTYSPLRHLPSSHYQESYQQTRPQSYNPSTMRSSIIPSTTSTTTTMAAGQINKCVYFRELLLSLCRN